MSISTPQGGGPRRPTVAKPAAGAKPKPEADDIVELDEDDLDDIDDIDDADPIPAHPRARRPAATAKSAKPVKKAPAKKAAPTKSAFTSGGPGKKAGSRPGAKGAGPRRPIAPVKAAGGRNLGPTLLFVAVIVIAVGIIGYGGWQVYQNGLTWSERANRIEGIQNYTSSEKELLKGSVHQWGPVDYKYKPPFGGPHNENWQRCMGDVYDKPIASEHAVHSLEHGAIWITYQPNLPADQVAALAKKVKGNDFMLMSPHEGLDKPISLQAWGYQLKVDNASDKRIDEFVRALRQQAGPEKATCSSGNMITETGTAPYDIGKPAASGAPAAGG